jgi:hypothetical protein
MLQTNNPMNLYIQKNIWPNLIVAFSRLSWWCNQLVSSVFIFCYHGWGTVDVSVHSLMTFSVLLHIDVYFLWRKK